MIAAGRLRINLTTKIALLLLLQLLGAVTGLVAFTSYLAQTEHDGHVINVAGRQRMLSVQIRAYAHMVSIGQDADREGLAELVRTFDAALEALHRGGTVMGERVPPAPEGTRSEISRVVALWTPMKPQLATVVGAPRSDPRFAEASRYVEAHAEELRVAADRFVHAYEARTRRLQERMLRVLVGVVSLSVVLLPGSSSPGGTSCARCAGSRRSLGRSVPATSRCGSMSPRATSVRGAARRPAWVHITQPHQRLAAAIRTSFSAIWRGIEGAVLDEAIQRVYALRSR